MGIQPHASTTAKPKSSPAASKPKIPTASGISRLLADGYERAVISVRGGTSGFQVTRCHGREGRVEVRQYFQLGGASLESYQDKLGRYAKTIEAAGYSVEVCPRRLIVTAKPAPAAPGDS